MTNNTPKDTPVLSSSDGLAYERAYFERGFICAAAWAMTKKPDAVLSDDVIDHAWAHRDEGMDAEDLLPVAALASTPQRTGDVAELRAALIELRNSQVPTDDDARMEVAFEPLFVVLDLATTLSSHGTLKREAVEECAQIAEMRHTTPPPLLNESPCQWQRRITALAIRKLTEQPK